MAVMYSKLGGYLGDTAKLGPLARTDLCAWVKGLLDRLITHFGLGSSEEDPWGSLLGGRGWVAFPGTSVTCLGSAVPLRSLGGPVPRWAPNCLSACLSHYLSACLSWGVIACLWRTFPCRSAIGGLHCLPGKNIGKFNWPHIWDRVLLNT